MGTTISGKAGPSKMAAIDELALPDNGHFNKRSRIDAAERSAFESQSVQASFGLRPRPIFFARRERAAA